jgi:dihydrolipoamide dehydrogenase
MLDGPMQGADRDLVKIWQKMNAHRFDNIMLKTKTVSAKATAKGIEVTFAPAVEGGTAPAPQTYDLVLQAVGRSPNGKKIAADKAGVAVTDRGFINVDLQMRTNVPHIFAIANGRDEGVTKLLFDDSPEAHGHGKILGGGMVGTHAGDMIGEIALAIEMGADAVDIGKTIHPHPKLGESIGMAAEIAHGSCTDVPPARK